MENSSFSVVDIEVTEEKEIVQLAIINLDKEFNIILKKNYYIKPKNKISRFIEKLTGITNELLEDKPKFSQVAKEIHNLIKDNVLVCHGVVQDYNIIKENFENVNIIYEPKFLLDTVELTKVFFPTAPSYKLGDIVDFLDIQNIGYFHNAEVDAEVTVKLLLKTIEKINILSNIGCRDVLRILEKYVPAITKFVTKVRKNKYGRLKKQKNIALTANLESQKFLFVSSIPEEDYITINLQNFSKDIAIIKDKLNYLPDDFKKYIFSNNKLDNRVGHILIAKIVVWNEETLIGDLDEINIDANEALQLELMKEYFKKSKSNNFFENALNIALSKKFVVTNYNSFNYLLNSNFFADYSYVFEDKLILGTQIKNNFTKILYYKHVVTELNIANSNKKIKKLTTIQQNLDSIIQYLHEMYLMESLGLYNEAIEFILQDIDMLIEELKKINLKLTETSKFLTTLKNILLENNVGNYKFEILHTYNSLCLKYHEIKKEKIVINKIYKNNYIFLKNVVKIDASREKLIVQDIGNVILENKEYSNKRYLYIFESSKYKDLYYAERDKKSKIKCRNFSTDNNFSELFRDITKNKQNGYICYANKEIMNYKMYLKLMFDEIISFKNVEL